MTWRERYEGILRHLTGDLPEEHGLGRLDVEVQAGVSLKGIQGFHDDLHNEALKGLRQEGGNLEDLLAGGPFVDLDALEAATCGCRYDPQAQRTVLWCDEHGPYDDEEAI